MGTTSLPLEVGVSNKLYVMYEQKENLKQFLILKVIRGCSMKKGIVCFLFVLLFPINLFANKQIYPLYDSSLAPYAVIKFAEWSDAENNLIGLILKVPKDTVEIDVLVSGKGTKIQAYTYNYANYRIKLQDKLGEGISSEVGEWTKIKISKLYNDSDIFLRFDFSNSIGKYLGNLPVSYKVFKDSYIKLVYHNVKYNSDSIEELEWNSPTFPTVKDGDKYTVRPYIKFIKEGNYNLESFEVQPGATFINNKLRFRIKCFNKCENIKIDLNGDDIFDFVLDDNDENDNNLKEGLIDFYYVYSESKIYNVKVCSENSNDCLQSVAVIANTNIKMDSLFGENVYVFWPEKYKFLKNFAQYAISAYDVLFKIGFFDYWGFKTDFLPNYVVISYPLDKEFAKDLCVLYTQDKNFCNKEAIINNYLDGSTENIMLAGETSSITSLDIILHEFAGHPFDQMSNLMRFNHDITKDFPIWRYEGVPVIMSGNIGYGNTYGTRHYTAQKVLKSDSVLEDFIHKTSDDVVWGCNGAATDCYRLSSSLCGVIFPEWWLTITQEQFRNYYKKLGYEDHVKAFYEVFGYDNNHVWEQLVDWASDDVPDFIRPQLIVVDPNKLKFKLEGEGNYLILIYLNGSLRPTKKLFAKSNEIFELTDFKKFKIETLRLVIRQVKFAEKGWPLLSEGGSHYVLLFKENKKHFLNLTDYNGAIVIDSTQNSDLADDIVLMNITSRAIIPEMVVYKNKICFDLTNFSNLFDIMPLYDTVYFNWNNRESHFIFEPADNYVLDTDLFLFQYESKI
ncbi:hypothetical protein DBT_2390 [Dissulfuribacter thermophilus]|uniref:Uncharacterized protein n=1 Tax=Dissulfuribacter thermophilus TaxID=1156395 RepID=A0A1B9F2Z2_9BACT|nr:hypothetical protein [Dissulfuribacter thermophilus]OCC14185.1 hypothetical protein DBT_2390 [Dissulfuribacter thermophilus]